MTVGWCSVLLRFEAMCWWLMYRGNTKVLPK